MSKNYNSPSLLSEKDKGSKEPEKKGALDEALTLNKRLLRDNEVGVDKTFLKWGTYIDIFAGVIIAPYIFGWIDYTGEEWERWLLSSAFLGFVFRSIISAVLGKVNFLEKS